MSEVGPHVTSHPIQQHTDRDSERVLIGGGGCVTEGSEIIQLHYIIIRTYDKLRQ